MAEAESAVLPTPIPTSLNLMARQFGVARATVERRLKKGWLPLRLPVPPTVVGQDICLRISSR